VRLVEELERLPGIGRRSAERLAHHLVRTPEAEALALAEAIREARRRIRPCTRCRAPSETDPCPLCGDPARDASILMVVETARDLAAIEDAGRYRGLYYVLGGRLSPLEGVTARDLDLAGLVARASADAVREVCLATNPDLEGDGPRGHSSARSHRSRAPSRGWRAVCRSAGRSSTRARTCSPRPSRAGSPS
jgi:recombination protein RecR